MSLKCVYSYPGAVPQIKRLVEWSAHKLHSQNKSATVQSVYNYLRENNFELDAETVAYAYSLLPHIVGKTNFSSLTQLHDFGGETMREAIAAINAGTTKLSRMGKANVPQSVASGIAKTFAALQGLNSVDKTRMVQLRDAVRKAAMSQLDKEEAGPVQAPPKTFVEVLEAAFNVEDLDATADQVSQGYVTGLFSTMDDMWRAVQEEVKEISEGIDDDSQREQFDLMTETLINSSYDLLLSTREVNDVMKGIMRDAGYTRDVAGTQVVDWNKALRDQENWQETFKETIMRRGFTEQQTDRVITRLENSYQAALRHQAENRMNAISQRVGKVKPINKTALNRLVDLRHAGVFDANNRQTLMDVFNMDIPQEIVEEISALVKEYEVVTKKTGALSNVEAEDVNMRIGALLQRVPSTWLDKSVNAFQDYISIGAASAISTTFNAFQNMTSGLFSAMISSVRPIVKTGNPRLAASFIRTWTNAFGDVVLGGVNIRDSKTVNSLDALMGRGALSERWTFDQVRGPGSFVRALITILPQITATAFDAANKSVIMQTALVNNFRSVLISKGKGPSEANRIIDEVMFGRDENTGKTYRKLWMEEAKTRLETLEGIPERKVKAGRIADELVWHKLVEDYGISFDEVKAVQSAAIRQGGLNLGHEGDIMFAPSNLINAASNKISQFAETHKARGNRGMYVAAHMTNTIFRATNMFVGGIGNWAVLTLQTTPLGILQGGVDAALKRKEMFGPLAQDDPKKLRDQLKTRNAVMARLERGIIGLGIQTGLYALLMSAFNDDDDEETRGDKMKALFEAQYQDRDVRRALEKSLPMLMSAEMAYAYDKKTKQVNPDKVSDIFMWPAYLHGGGAFVDYAKEQILAKNFWGRVDESLKYANFEKDPVRREELKSEAWARNVGYMFGVPYMGWWDMVNKEYRVVSTNFEPNEEIEEQNANKFREDLKTVDGMTDAFLLGAHMGLIRKLLKDEEE